VRRALDPAAARLQGRRLMTLRLIVSGSRFLTAERHQDAVVQGLVWAGKLLGRDTVLVHGACPAAHREGPDGWDWYDGLDEIASTQWERWGLSTEAHPADWNGRGPAAGPTRNEEMAVTGADICMVWPHPDPRQPSTGTWDMAGRGLAHSITVISGWTLTPVLEVPDRSVRGPHGVLLRPGVIAVGQ
jgi:hypothetical protein